jgi:hypothetical protein
MKKLSISTFSGTSVKVPVSLLEIFAARVVRMADAEWP